MALSWRTLIKGGYKCSLTETGNEIISFLSLSIGKNQEEIREHLLKGNNRRKRSDSLNNIVSNYLTAFEKLGYIRKEGMGKNHFYFLTPKYEEKNKEIKRLFKKKIEYEIKIRCSLERSERESSLLQVD